MRISSDPPPDQPARPPGELEHHPAASLFPLLPINSPEFGELVADIGAQGLLQPIVPHEGRILDGRNRYRACQHAGVEPRITTRPTCFTRQPGGTWPTPLATVPRSP